MIYSNVLQYKYQQNQDSQHEYDYLLYKRKALGIGVVYPRRVPLPRVSNSRNSTVLVLFFSLRSNVPL